MAFHGNKSEKNEVEKKMELMICCLLYMQNAAALIKRIHHTNLPMPVWALWRVKHTDQNWISVFMFLTQ